MRLDRKFKETKSHIFQKALPLDPLVFYLKKFHKIDR